jgi:hypothetical protein
MRKELQSYIAEMPERSLYALRPLLNVLVDDRDDILSDEDAALYAECERDLLEHRSRFMSLDAYKRKRGLA